MFTNLRENGREPTDSFNVCKDVLDFYISNTTFLNIFVTIVRNYIA